MALTDMLNTSWTWNLKDKVSQGLVGIKRNADQAERSMGHLDKKVDGFGAKLKGGFGGLSSTAMAGVGGFVAGLATNALATFNAGALTEAADANKALGQIQAGLLSTKGISGQTVDSLIADSKRLRENSLFGDDEIVQKLQAQLLTFTNITGTNFKRAEQGAIDLASRLGGDLQGSAIMLGKALNDPIQGLTALRRVGVSFTESQQKIIKGLVQQNDLFGAQKIILDTIEEQYGGSGKAASDSFAGSLHRQSEAVKDLQESWGTFLFKSGIVEGATKFFQGLGDIAQGNFGNMQAIKNPVFDELVKRGFKPTDFRPGKGLNMDATVNGKSVSLGVGGFQDFNTYYNRLQYPNASTQQQGFNNQFGGRGIMSLQGGNGAGLMGTGITGIPKQAGAVGTSLQDLQDRLKDLNEQYALDKTPVGSASRKGILADIADVERQIKKLTDPLESLNKAMNKEMGGINSRVVTEKTPRIITVNIDKLVEQFTVNSNDSGLSSTQIRAVIEKTLIDSVRDVEQGLGSNG